MKKKDNALQAQFKPNNLFLNNGSKILPHFPSPFLTHGATTEAELDYSYFDNVSEKCDFLYIRSIKKIFKLSFGFGFTSISMVSNRNARF